MTNLDFRPVIRETRALHFERSQRKPIVVKLEVGGRVLRLKRKGDRRWYSVAYESILQLAIKIAVEDAKKAKRLAREQRRKVGP